MLPLPLPGAPYTRRIVRVDHQIASHLMCEDRQAHLTRSSADRLVDQIPAGTIIRPSAASLGCLARSNAPSAAPTWMLTSGMEIDRSCCDQLKQARGVCCAHVGKLPVNAVCSAIINSSI